MKLHNGNGQRMAQSTDNVESRERRNRRTYSPPTTAEQRHILFETWQETGNIRQACRKAGVSRTTFYYWQERFLAHGFPALTRPRSNAPHNPKRIARNIAEKVIQLRRENPTWGKLRIANEINHRCGAKSVSPSTVRRVLLREDLW